MCDKRIVDRNKINQRRRKERNIVRAVAREIKMHELAYAGDSLAEPTEAVQANREHRLSVIGQRESSDTEESAQKDGGCRSGVDENSIEQELEERGVDIREEEEMKSDRSESVMEAEDRENDGMESVEKCEERDTDGLESAEEREEMPEYQELREWAIESNVSQKNLDKLLSILRRRCLPALPKSAKTFLKTDSCSYFVNESGNGQFVFFGIKSGLKACVIETLHPDNQIFLQFNIDGLPIFKSSAIQFWPILCRVHCPKFDVYSPFLVACYCGDSKPPNLADYFRDFIEEINQLQGHGIMIDRKIFQIRVKCFICDSPARALMKNIKGHGGFSACERCNVHGERVEKNRGFCTVYPEVNKQRRTDESFRNLDDPNHHNGSSPLLDIHPLIDMVEQILLDMMHLLDRGAMEKLLGCCITGDLRVRLGRRSRELIDRRITCLRSQIPCEFQRKPRTTNYLAKWKCTEFRLFLPCIGPIVLQNILPSDLYKHFLLLHAAARILCSEDFALKYNNLAKTYLEKFVLASKHLYGAHYLSLNTHNLIHIADDAKNMGCSLSCISAYPFENFLGKLKKSIRTAHLPLSQVCRRMHEAQLIRIKRPTIPQQIQIMKTRINEDGTEHAKKLRCKTIILSDRAPDNVVLLKDSTIMQIDRMIVLAKKPDTVRIESREWKKAFV